MSRWTDAMVREALGLGAGEPTTAFTGVHTDSRTIEPGSLFVALKGERFDAHDFLADVAAKGAAGAVVSRIPADAPALTYYEVQDTLVALCLLARFYRRQQWVRHGHGCWKCYFHHPHP